MPADRKSRQPKIKIGAKDLQHALTSFGADHGIRHIRIFKSEALPIAIRDEIGQVYKAYSAGDNHRAEIYVRSDGSWGREIITVFDANQKDFVPAWRRHAPDARLLVALHKNDLVKLLVNGEERVMRVVSLWDDRLQLAAQNEGGVLEKRHDDPDDPFRWLFVSYNRLRSRLLRKITVDWLGRVRDPGPLR